MIGKGIVLRFYLDVWVSYIVWKMVVKTGKERSRQKKLKPMRNAKATHTPQKRKRRKRKRKKEE